MYAIVFSSLGMTTLSSALTRRLVVLIASSSVRKAVCRLASSTSSSTAVMYACGHSTSGFKRPGRPLKDAGAAGQQIHGSHARLRRLQARVLNTLDDYTKTRALLRQGGGCPLMQAAGSARRASAG